MQIGEPTLRKKLYNEDNTNMTENLDLLEEKKLRAYKMMPTAKRMLARESNKN